MARETVHLVTQLVTVSGAVRKWADAVAASHGQTHARWQVLATLQGQREMTVPQVARRLGLTRQSVQRVIDQLFAEGLVTWCRNPDHKTSPLLRLSDAGEGLAQSLDDSAGAASKDLLRHIEASELVQLSHLLTRLSQAIK